MAMPPLYPLLLVLNLRKFAILALIAAFTNKE